MSVKVGLPPIAAADARLFILGSLPGDASLAAQRYYAHPHNQFWRLLGAAIGEELHALDYDERLERLAERRIGLWDVVASASAAGQPRPGDPRRRPQPHRAAARATIPTCAPSPSTAGPPPRSGAGCIGRAPALTLIDLPRRARPTPGRSPKRRRLGGLANSAAPATCAARSNAP